jgi:hypothetical protein
LFKFNNLDNLIEQRPYQKGDEVDIIKILSKAFKIYSENVSPIDYWNWKYSSPKGSVINVIKVNNEIVGVGHGILLNLKIGNEIILASLSGDVTVDHEYRGMGFFEKIVGMTQKLRKEKGCSFNYITSSNPIVVNRKKDQMNYTFPKKIVYMARINDVGLHLINRPLKNNLLIDVGYNALKTFNQLINQFSSTSRSTDFVIDEITHFDSDFDVFWDKIKVNYNFIFEKNREYLNWRYTDPRGGNYHIFRAKISEIVIGFIVLQIINVDDYQEGFVTDMLALNDRTDVVDALMMNVCDFVDKNKVNVVYYEVIEGNSYYDVAYRRGFLNSGKGPWVNCHMTEEMYNTIHQSSSDKVYFNYGDLF